MSYKVCVCFYDCPLPGTPTTDMRISVDEATCYGVFWCHWCVWKSLPICVRATPECMCVDSVNKSNLYKLIRCNLQCVCGHVIVCVGGS